MFPCEALKDRQTTYQIYVVSIIDRICTSLLKVQRVTIEARLSVLAYRCEGKETASLLKRECFDKTAVTSSSVAAARLLWHAVF